MIGTKAAAAVFLTGVGLALAGPTHAENAQVNQVLADPNALGTYNFEASSGEASVWTVTPCKVDQLHCVHVSATGNNLRQAFSGDAYWTVGSWIMFVDQSDAILCANGTSEPGRNTYSWDATSLSGSASLFTGSACGQEGGSVSIPFDLTKTGGPPRLPEAPVQYEPYVVDIPPPYAPPSAEAPAAMPAESDPAIVATPNVIPNESDPLTEAIVAEPGYNASGGGGGGRR
ncbi:MAG: hypothetical protein WCH82_10860 [Mycobacteriaceae bacterium]